MIPYITAGEECNIDRWNAISEELDRKLGIALDGKSIFFMPGGGWRGLAAQRFYFIQSDRTPICDHLFEPFEGHDYVNYNHEVFTDYVSTALRPAKETGAVGPRIWIDLDRKVIALTEIDSSSAARELWLSRIGRNASTGSFIVRFLCYSLEAHKFRYKVDAGSGAAGTVIIQDGRAIRVDISNPGSNYPIPPIMTIEGDGEGARGDCLLYNAVGAGNDWSYINSTVQQTFIRDGGEGYTSATVSFDGSNGERPFDYYSIWMPRSDFFEVAEDFWLEQPLNYYQSELIVSGEQYRDGFHVPANYNKYNFFRVHNINNFPLAVKFFGTSGVVHTVTVSALGSKCVRREDIDTGYVDGFSHFHRMQDGDPRYMVLDAAPSGQNNSLRFNNVTNPFIQFEYFEAARKYLNLLTDEREFWRAPEYHNQTTNKTEWEHGDFRPLPAVGDDTPIGDLIAHRGKLITVDANGGDRKEITFQGFGSIVADFAAAGITVTESGGFLVFTCATDRDLIQVSSNILTALGGNPIMRMNPSISLSLPQFAGRVFSQLTPRVLTSHNQASVTWYSYSYSGGIPILAQANSETSSGQSCTAVSGSSVTFLPLLASTVKQLKNGMFNGVAGLESAGQATSCYSLEREVFLSGFGLVYRWTERTKLVASISGGGVISAPEYRIEEDEQGAQCLARSGVDSFSGGFPFYSTRFQDVSQPGTITPPPNWTPNLSPKLNRLLVEYRTVSPVSVYHSGKSRTYLPDWNYYFDKGIPDGNSVPSGIPTPIKTTSTGWLARWERRTLANVIDKFYNNQTGYTSEWYRINRGSLISNSPVVHESPSERLPLLIDHYNALASVVNCMAKVTPLDFIHFYSSNTYFGLPPIPRTFGGFITTVYGALKPINHYATIFSAEVKTAFQNLGIRTRTAGQIDPAIKEIWEANGRYFHSPNGTTINAYDIAQKYGTNGVDAEYNACVAAGGKLLTSLWKEVLFGSSTGNERIDNAFEWVSVEDVAERCEELGWRFHYASIVAPIKFEIHDSEFEELTGNTVIAGGNYNIPARIPAFSNEEDGQYCLEPEAYRLGPQEPADVMALPLFSGQWNDSRRRFTDGTSSTRIVAVTAPAGWRRINKSQTTYATHPTPPQVEYGVLCLRNYGSNSNSKAILLPSSYFDYGSDFSKNSDADAVARQVLGPRIIPATPVNVQPSPAEIIDLDEGLNFITANGAAEVYLLADFSVDLNED